MTRSWSPTEAPPVVTSMSAPATASATAAIAARSSRATGSTIGSPPAARTRAARAWELELTMPPGGNRFARHGDLVAGRQYRDARAAVDGEPGMVGGGGQADVARGQPATDGHHHVAGGKVLAGAADVAARAHRLVDLRSISPSRVASSCSRIASAPSRHDAAGERCAPPRRDRRSRRTGARGAVPITRRTAPSVPVVGTNGVAVHGRDIGWRLRQPGDHRRGGDAVPRRLQGQRPRPGGAQRLPGCAARASSTLIMRTSCQSFPCDRSALTAAPKGTAGSHARTRQRWCATRGRTPRG